MLAKGTTLYQNNSLANWVECSPMGDQGSIPGRVIPKTLKWYLTPPCLTLSNIKWGSRVTWSNPGKGVAPSPTSWCINYWKGSLLVALDYGRQLLLTYCSQVRSWYFSFIFFNLMKYISDLIESLFLTTTSFIFFFKFCVVCMVLWHINLCRLFNAKSIFM